MIRSKLEIYFQRLFLGKKRTFGAKIVKCFLFPFGLIYRFIVKIRNWGYEKGWFRTYYPPIPVVISVGNIALGGTGKTPFTLFLAEHLSQEFSLAILSRGYRSQAERLKHPIRISKAYQAAFCGDEPYLMSQRLPNVPIFVGRNRKRAAEMAAEEGAEIIVLDDGLQHRKLARDFEVVILNAQDSFEKVRFPPFGFFREDFRALKRSHLIVINQVEDADHFVWLKEKLMRKITVPMIGTRWKPQRVIDLKRGKDVQIGNKQVGMFCSIARPENFLSTLESKNAIIVASKIFPDHAKLEKEELVSFARQCQELGAECMICTEKDKVKLNPREDFPLPICWVKMELELVAGHPDWEAFLSQVKGKL